ncbi:MAG: Asp-tRNA(Asn)/Glu-tRNA(Gln) amidotransferase subunit GatC [Planctomycetes bacterium]|nr:Asp-tRNA(Asn)/Glu-tRNA(Gln) amidotransferase subunit GatC [Planctomycetota bacterium]
MLDPKTVKHVAMLARLEVPEERLGSLTAEMAAIISYVEQLKDLDVSAVAPLTHAGTSHDILRDDIPHEPLPRDSAMANAPRREGPYYLVPRVIGEA